MPTVHLSYTSPGTTPAHSQLASLVTALTAQHLRKRADLTLVHVQQVEPADWFVGGVSAAEIGLAGYRLRIDVSAGSNTESEMASYIAAMHAALADALGPVEPASYVIVQEQPMTNWGWSGRTQAARSLGWVVSEPEIQEA